MGGRREDFESVLARIARARHHEPHAAPLERAVVHEGKPGRSGHDGADDLHRFGPLQRQQRTVVGAMEPGAVSFGGAAQHREVILLCAGIDDDVERARVTNGAGDHQVIQRATLPVEQQGVADLSRLQVEDVAADQGLDDRSGARVLGFGVAAVIVAEPEEARSHVGYIEETGVLARPLVFGDDARRILYRQRIAGERHHAAAQRHVPVVEDDGFESLGRRFGHGSLAVGRHPRNRTVALCPLCPLT